MKNKLLNQYRWLTCLGMIVILSGLSEVTQAQTTITNYHPVAGFIGDTIVISGTGLDNTVSVDLGGVSAEFKIVNATEVEFIIPEGAEDLAEFSISDGVETIVPQTTNKDDEVVDADARIFIPDEVSPFEQIVFFESITDPFIGGSPNGGSLEDHENNDRFVNDEITISGTGNLSWGTQGTTRDYSGASAQFGIAISDGEYFQIDGINTDDLENVRLSFAVGSWYTVIGGGLEISSSIDGGTTWVSLGGISDYNVQAWSFKRIGKVLPSATSLSLRFEFNQVESLNDLVFDDIKVTGFPAGIATVSEFVPAKAKPGKSLLIKGASLGDVKTVRFVAEDDSNIDVTDLEIAGDGQSITVMVPQGVKTSQIVLINSKDVEFPSVDDLEIEDASPSATEFLPAAAPIGGLIVISGENLYNVEGVSFNNVEATEFYYVDDETLEIYVPEGAGTGTLVVTTKQGTYNSNEEVLWDPDNNPDTENSIDIKLGDFAVDSTVPILTLSLSATDGKEGESISLIAKLSAAAGQDVKLAISAGGDVVNADDFTLANDTITIAGGSVESDIVLLELLDDGDDFEEIESLEITLVGAIGEAVLGKPRVQTIQISQPTVLSVVDNVSGQEIILYQSAEGLNFQLKGSAGNKEATAFIYDMNGKQMYLNKFQQIADKITVSEANQFKPGVYVLKLANIEGQLVRKFVIK